MLLDEVSRCIRETMYPLMASAAQRYDVRHVAPQLRMSSPRLDVVSGSPPFLVAAYTLLAALAGVTIAGVHAANHRLPLLSFVETLTLWCCAAPPCGIALARLYAQQGFLCSAALDSELLQEPNNGRSMYLAFGCYVGCIAPRVYVLRSQPRRIPMRLWLVPMTIINVLCPPVFSCKPMGWLSTAARAQCGLAKLSHVLKWPTAFAMGVSFLVGANRDAFCVQNISHCCIRYAKVATNKFRSLPRSIRKTGSVLLYDFGFNIGCNNSTPSHYHLSIVARMFDKSIITHRRTECIC